MNIDDVFKNPRFKITCHENSLKEKIKDLTQPVLRIDSPALDSFSVHIPNKQSAQGPRVNEHLVLDKKTIQEIPSFLNAIDQNQYQVKAHVVFGENVYFLSDKTQAKDNLITQESRYINNPDIFESTNRISVEQNKKNDASIFSIHSSVSVGLDEDLQSPIYTAVVSTKKRLQEETASTSKKKVPKKQQPKRQELSVASTSVGSEKPLQLSPDEISKISKEFQKDLKSCPDALQEKSITILYIVKYAKSLDDVRSKFGTQGYNLRGLEPLPHHKFKNISYPVYSMEISDSYRCYFGFPDGIESSPTVLEVSKHKRS